MTEQLSAVAAFLRRHDNYDILTHDYPDGDTLGSAFALCLVLQQMGKHARVITTYLPDDFLFLQKDVEKQDFVAQTVVSVDVADTKLLGSNRAVYEGKIDLCIDHHMTNKVMVPLRLVDGGAAANCEILYKLFQHMEISWTRAIANCLYTGISTDTGCFRYTNTRNQVQKADRARARDLRYHGVLSGRTLRDHRRHAGDSAPCRCERRRAGGSCLHSAPD